MNRVDEKAKKDCCGCMECAFTCPTHAITMKRDELGFHFPEVDEDLCIHCKKCLRKCQFPVCNVIDTKELDFPKIFAGRLKVKEELLNSQSGGAFYAIAKEILKLGGVVYGAAYSNTFSVIHLRVADLSSLNSIRGSKYVQSSLSGIYESIRKDLNVGRTVLFSGTSCQVAGIKAEFGRKYSNQLVTIDVLCYGVCSPNLWQDYLKYLEKRYSKSLTSVNMRNKHDGWKGASEAYTFANKKCVKSNSFLYLYFQNLPLRDCCYHCPYTNINRVGDLSLGDFWNWEKSGHEEFNDNKGISLIIVNNQRGLDLLREARAQLDIISSNITECIQDVLVKPVPFNPNRDDFFRIYLNQGFKKAAIKYGDLGFVHKLRVNLSSFKYKLLNLLSK